MEPMASPTWSDLLQTIKEKEKYRVSADYLLREIAGEYRDHSRRGCVSDFECCNGSKRYRRIPLNTFQQPHTISEVVAQAAEEYEAPEEKIQDSVLNFVHDTFKISIIRGGCFIMRKEWMEPVIEVQEFVANEYVAACESGMVYKFTCDAPRGRLYYYPEGDGTINGSYTGSGRAVPIGFYHTMRGQTRVF